MAPRPPMPRGPTVGDWNGWEDWGVGPGSGVDTSTGIGTSFGAMRPSGVDMEAWVEAYNMAGKLGTMVGSYSPDSTVIEY